MDARVRGAVLLAAITLPAVAYAQPKPKSEPAAEPPEEPPAPEPEKPVAAPPEPVKAAPVVAPDPALPPPSKVKFTWAPFGFLRLQYKMIQNDPNVEFVGRDDGFELQNARIGVRGTLEDRAAFVVSFDGAVDERAQINQPEGKLRVGLRDAYADYFLGKRRDRETGAIQSEMLVRAGFFQTWAEPQVQVPDVLREFIDRPLESRGIRPTEGFQTQGLTPRSGCSRSSATRRSTAASSSRSRTAPTSSRRTTTTIRPRSRPRA
jgi:hypothetical protein